MPYLVVKCAHCSVRLSYVGNLISLAAAPPHMKGMTRPDIHFRAKRVARERRRWVEALGTWSRALAPVPFQPPGLVPIAAWPRPSHTHTYAIINVRAPHSARRHRAAPCATRASTHAFNSPRASHRKRHARSGLPPPSPSDAGRATSSTMSAPSSPDSRRR